MSEDMPKKRKSRGRRKGKGGAGRARTVTCSNCGALVPRDKAKKTTRYHSLVERTLAKELEQSGALIRGQRRTRYFCISCAIHFGVVKVGRRR